MRAVRLTAYGAPPVLTEVAEPEAGPGDVLVRVAGAGVCHSDLHVIDAKAAGLPFRPPFTLGHEVAGWVSALGEGASGFAIGDPVAVYGPWGCGQCQRCRAGTENYCDRRAELGFLGVGLGIDGGMAATVRVPSTRLLVPLGDLEPWRAAALTDAALTSYHAISGCRADLSPTSAALVIGVGGLGHLAVQLLRALTKTRIIALDTREEALVLAERSGADRLVRAGPAAGQRIRAATDGYGVDAVFDFVGSDPTLALASEVLRGHGELVIVGSGGGRLTVTKPAALPPGTRISLPYWGSRPDLVAVIELAQRGQLRVAAEAFPLEQALDVFARLRAGTIAGRAVLVPG